jgi:hypothetical protein
MPMSVRLASVPATTIASASPAWIVRSATPMTWPPVAHAEQTANVGPRQPRRIAA